MEEKLLETVITTFTKALIEESKELFSDIYDQVHDETKQFIGKDLKNYLKKQQDKYSHIKTLLKGNTPVYLYDIYFPSKLVRNNTVHDTSSISKLFLDSKYITIIGDAGSGKSTLVKHLFLNAIFEKFKIPILIELRYLNEDTRNLEDFMKEITTLNRIAVTSEILERFLEKGKFVFFLDGYDELEETTKKRITKQLNDFVNKYDSNNFILTTRPYSNIEQLPLFYNVHMKDLSLENGEIKGFIYKQLGTEKEIAEKVIKSIEQGKSQYIKSFLRNPLLLSLYILTFQRYASIPDKKYIFYRRVINALFSEHDSKTKLGFVREKQSGLNQEQFESILKAFSIISYFENYFVFDRDYINQKLKVIKSKQSISFDNNKFIMDLKSAIALWVDDDGQLAFAHRSLQEYFTALFIKELQPEENSRVYSKIVNRFAESKGRPLNEVENLLSLLSELDEFNYNKNYYLPILKELKSSLNPETDFTLSKSLLNFFIDGIGFSTEERLKRGKRKDVYIVPLLKDKIYKTINVHLPFTRKLYDHLLDKLNEENTIDINYPGICKTDEVDAEADVEYRLRNTFKHLDLDEGNFDAFFTLIYNEDLVNISKKYYEFLEKKLRKTQNYLDKTVIVEKDIIDLI